MKRIFLFSIAFILTGLILFGAIAGFMEMKDTSDPAFFGFLGASLGILSIIIVIIAGSAFITFTVKLVKCIIIEIRDAFK